MSGSNTKRHLPLEDHYPVPSRPSPHSSNKRRAPGFSTWNRSGVPGNYHTVKQEEDDINDGLNHFANLQKEQMTSFLDDLCKVCRRKNSLNSNQLVSCCKCRNFFHQLCHPGSQIDDLFIVIPGASWRCYACQQERAYLPLNIGATAAGFTLTERKAYLLSLSTYYLIDIILYCETKDPDLDIYPPNLRLIVQQEATNNDNRSVPSKMVPLDGSIGSNTGSEMLFASPLLCQFLKDGSLEDLVCGLLVSPTFGRQPVSLQTLISWLQTNASHLFKVLPSFHHSLIGAIKNAIAMGRLLETHQLLQPNPRYLHEKEDPTLTNLSLPRLSSSLGSATIAENPSESTTGSIILSPFSDPLTVSSNGISYPSRLSLKLPPMSREDNDMCMVYDNQDAFSQRTYRM